MKSSYLITGVLILSSLTLAACTAPGKEKNFSSVYEWHVERVFSEIDGAMKDSPLSFVGTEEDTLRFLLDIPSYGSWEMHAALSAKMRGLSSESNISLTGKVMSMGESFILNEAKWALISVAGDVYGRVDSLDMTGSLARTVDIADLKQYYGKWISFRTQDMMSGEVDMTASKIQSNLYKVKLEDIKKYLLQYPTIRPVWSGGINGKDYVYNVELDRENVGKIIIALYEQLAETGATAEMKADLAKGLSGVTLTGTLAVDSSDLLYFSFTGRLVTEDGTSLDIHESYQRDGLRLTISNAGITFSLVSLKTDGKNRSTMMTLTAPGTDVKLSLLNNDETITALTGAFNAQGMNGTMNYVRSNDGTFSGAVMLPMGNTFVWNGKGESDTLKALSMNANVSGWKMVMNLVEKDGWVTWPLTVTSGEEQVVTGTISLRSMKDVFWLRGDISIVGVPGVNHIEMDATMKQNKDEWVKIEAPKDAIPFNTVAEAMGAYAYPTGDDIGTYSWMNSDMSDISLDDLPIDEEMTPEQKAELEKIMKSMTGIAMPQ